MMSYRKFSAPRHGSVGGLPATEAQQQASGKVKSFTEDDLFISQSFWATRQARLTLCRKWIGQNSRRTRRKWGRL
jgi:hypothetical protein